MRNTILILLLLLSKNLLFAQEYSTIEVLNLETETARLAVNQTFKDLKLPTMHIWKNQTYAESSFYSYTSLLIKNRFIFKVNIEPNVLTVSINNRQYQSNGSWVDNPLPMSKKQAAKILDPLKEKIIELTKDKAITSINNNTQINNDAIDIKKTGIYEDFVIVKTDDPEMELLAIHKNGNIIGFYLFDDKKTVKAMVYRENKDSEAVTMEFDKKGSPIAMCIKDLSFKILSTNDGELVFKLKDKDGNFIGEEKIATKTNFNIHKRDFYDDSKNHGPNASYKFQPLFPTINKDALSDGLGNSSFGFSIVAEAIDKLPEGSKIVNAVKKTYLKSLGKGLLLSYAIQKIDPENKFFLNELNTFTPAVLLAITEMEALATVSAVAAGTATVATTLALVAVIIGSAKVSYDAFMRLKERHWPTPIFVINKPTEPLRTGSFGEYRLSAGYIAIEYNYTDKKIEIISEHPEDLKLEFISVDHLNGYDKAYYNVKAKESKNKKHSITAFQIISSFHKYEVAEDTISNEIEITIKEPNYYYLTNCNNCLNDPSIKKECEEKLNECKLKIAYNQDIYFLLDEKNEIIECNEKLNDERLSFVKSSTPDNKGFKPFVTEYDCSINCKDFDNKESNNISDNVQTVSQNYISGKINVPIFVDQIKVEDHFSDDRRDSNINYDNIIFNISTQLKRIPISFSGKVSFSGNYIEQVYDLITKINISGTINHDTNLGTITVEQKETKNVKASSMNVCDFDYEYSYIYEYTNLKVSGNGINKNSTYYSLKPDKNTKVTLKKFKYIEDTKCPERNYSNEIIYKNINEEFLKEKLIQYFPYFHFTIN